MSQYTVIFPHLSSEINDECLELNLKMLKDNAAYDSDLTIITDTPEKRIDPYQAWNDAIPQAGTDYVLLTNTDMLMAPGFDRDLLKYRTPNAILTGRVVEPGVIGVAEENIRQDFGRCPRCFDRKKFERYAHGVQRLVPASQSGRGWVMPCLIHKDLFVRAGKFPTDQPFMHAPMDLKFYDRLNEMGVELIQVGSLICYHFQNLSHRSNRCSCYIQTSSNPAGF